jgi:hypothetical protein
MLPKEFNHDAYKQTPNGDQEKRPDVDAEHQYMWLLKEFDALVVNCNIRKL